MGSSVVHVDTGPKPASASSRFTRGTSASRWNPERVVAAASATSACIASSPEISSERRAPGSAVKRAERDLSPHTAKANGAPGRSEAPTPWNAASVSGTICMTRLAMAASASRAPSPPGTRSASDMGSLTCSPASTEPAATVASPRAATSSESALATANAMLSTPAARDRASSIMPSDRSVARMRRPGCIRASSKEWEPGPQPTSSTSGGRLPDEEGAFAASRCFHEASPEPSSTGSPVAETRLA
mmetsp:Transcript_3465/g.14277  ORF Transcript_3465/g.14277 Transcript_3465/m.14277 type:complete len:245 (+) Transcript_3465:377-1111(+)